MHVMLFRDFAEDNRISMDVYADGLRSALAAASQKGLSIQEYRPSLLFGHRSGVSWMRLSRFIGYPLQARRHQGQVNHILDHGYGHLLYALDPSRTVVTVHDLIPLVRFRGAIPGVHPGRRPWLNLVSFAGLRRAGHLIADSENTKQDLLRYCGCRPEDVSVIHPGLDPIFRRYSKAEKMVARATWGLPNDGTKRVLVAGSQFYKNRAASLRAFALLRKTYLNALQLIKIGPPDAEWLSLTAELGLQQVSTCLAPLPRADLADVYNCVDCLLFPSLYEGFGWPPLEAMACGIPVVASNAASLPEVVGDAGLMVGPHDIDGLALALRDVLTNGDLRLSLISRGLERARRFTWQSAAEKVLGVYEQISQQ